MTKTRMLLAAVLALWLPSAVSAADLAQAAKPTAISRGVPVTFDLWNATAGATLVVTLHNGARFFGVEPVADAEAWKGHLSFNDSTLKLDVPAALVGNADYPTLHFRAFMEFVRGASGHATLAKPLVFALRTPYGTPVVQSGNFAFDVPSGPPTCAVAGCNSKLACPKSANGQERSCHMYYSYLFCCVVSPFPSAARSPAH